MTNVLMKTSLLDFTRSLGQGKGMKGSGSAAALSGIMGLQLILSVCKITASKADDEQIQERLHSIIQYCEGCIENLTALLQEDVDAVSAFLKTKNADIALLDVPMQMIEVMVSAVPFGLEVMNIGYKVMRGDTATALSLLQAGVKSSIYIANENLPIAKDERSSYESKLASLTQDSDNFFKEVDDLLSKK